MSAPPPLDRPVHGPSPLAWPLLVLGTFGFAAAWAAVSLATGRTHGWLALVAALDVALLLRLGRWTPGPGRALGGTLAWLGIVALSTWAVISGHLGKVFGLSPWESALRLGAEHAWTLAGLAYAPADLAGLAAGLVLVVLASR